MADKHPLIFTRSDWMEQAHRLLPDCDQAKLDAMWADVERLDLEHAAREQASD